MGIGLISISTSAKKEPSGAPFPSGSANNGLSVDGGTGKIVLGNNVGDATEPAKLLSNREINMNLTPLVNPFTLSLVNTRRGITTALNGDTIRITALSSIAARVIVGNITGTTNVNAQITAQSDGTGAATIAARSIATGFSTVASTISSGGGGGVAVLQVAAGGIDSLNIQTRGTGFVELSVQGLFQNIAINTTTQCTKIQSTEGAAFNGATLQVSGTFTHRKFEQSQGAGLYEFDRDLDSGKVFRNSAAVTFDFPNFVGANFREGFYVDATVNDVTGITFNAGAGRLIRFGAAATSVNGTISSVTVGSFIRILIIDSFTFVTCFSTGTWVLT